jgi:hypothetical protein
MPPKSIPFEVRDLRNKHFFLIDDIYLNGYAKILGSTTSMVYFVLCRHVDKEQSCFPSQKYIGEKLNISDRLVRDKISILIKVGIIKKVRIRAKQTGKWLCNRYFLLDKSHWKKPEELGFLWHQRKQASYASGSGLPIKDTHIKDTHITNTDVLVTKSYGNQDITFLIDYLKNKLGLPMLDNSVSQNRHYCWLALQKFGGKDKIVTLIDATANDSFWQTRVTSFKSLYYNGVQIISKTRGVKPNVATI